MIHDATVEVTCDGNGCRESIVVSPEYVYNDYSGKSGHYDTKDRSLHKLIKAEGWTVVDEQTFCESCGESDDEDDEDDDE